LILPEAWKEHVKVCFGDIVNIVNVDAKNPLDDTERYKELTFMQGVDFIYNESF
jgi:hypothetical protein